MTQVQQMTIVSLEELVAKDHVYRKFNELWDFVETERELKKLERDNNYKGFGILRLFKCLLLQFMEDLSDRQLEKYLKENTSGKWFCGFGLTEQTPDHTVFVKVKKKIGVKKLSEIFVNLREQLKRQGYMNETFTFVDASSLISKANLWEERDKAIKEKYEKLNNETLPKVAHDKEARIGCKGNNKYWYGYKRHVSVDMQSGLINKVMVTPANVMDDKGLKHVCPKRGAIYTDKGYCTKEAKREAKKRNCHLAAIKKNNMREKNKDLDRWYSKIRAPYERVFSKQRKRTRYCGTVKNQFMVFMEAICFNLKRLAVLSPPNLCLS